MCIRDRFSDAFAVQFPVRLEDVRPYFLSGDSQQPVNLWSFDAGKGLSEQNARGMARVEEQPPQSQDLAGGGSWEEGRWTLLFRRALDTRDTDRDVQFRAEYFIPIAFFAWDGHDGQSGGVRSISSWYYLYLRRPTPDSVYMYPAVAMALTALVGIGVARRARRGQRTP